MFGFGKKIEIEVPNGQGGVKKVKVSKKQFSQLVDEGKLKPVEGCKAHILDPINGDYVENWVVGEQISKASYEKHKDKNGDIYVVVHYVAGEPKIYLAKKMLGCASSAKFWGCSP